MGRGPAYTPREDRLKAERDEARKKAQDLSKRLREEKGKKK